MKIAIYSKNFGISISDNPERTKRKSTTNGYRSEFVGLDLGIQLDENQILSLPIECQIQTMEQYKDGNIGFSAHSKLPEKGQKLSTIPRTGGSSRYTDPKGTLQYCKEYLSHIMHISPQYAIAKTTGNDFENGRITITKYDAYEALRLISRVPKGTPAFIHYTAYFSELYDKRDELLPAGDLPKYIRVEEIPNTKTGRIGYNRFFSELQSSLRQTIGQSLEVKENALDER